MHKKLQINQAKIKGGCQSGRKVVTNNSKSDLPREPKLFLGLNSRSDLHLKDAIDIHNIINVIKLIDRKF